MKSSSSSHVELLAPRGHVSIRVGSVRPSSRIVLFRFLLVQFFAFRFAAVDPSIIVACLVNLGSLPLDPSRCGTESDLELELVERPARFDSNQLELCVQAARA